MSTATFNREMMRDRFFRASVVTLVASVVVLLVAIVGAVRVQTVAAAPLPATIPDSALRFVGFGVTADLAAAAANDLFADDRQAPPKRYRLPGEASDTPRQPAPRPVVLGTALSDDGGSFAICQLVGGPSTVVRAGTRIGEFVVVSIERGRVAFRAADGERFSIDASKPVP